MKVASAGVLLICLASSTAAVAQATALSAPETAAARICERGEGDKYGHPSNGCWIAHERAVARQDYVRALAYARMGCEKYRRADHCLFTSASEQRTGQVVPVGTAASTAGAADALARGGRLVHPVDVEDGEHGVLLRESRANRRN